MKKFFWIVPGVVAFLIVLILIIPPLVDLGKYKARYLPMVEKALNRRIDVGEVHLRVLPSPAVRVSGLKVTDNPAFSTRTFFSAEAIRLNLKLRPLLKGQFLVEEFVLEKPVVNLIKRPDGSFNFSDLGKRDKKKGSERSEPGEASRLTELIPSQVNSSPQLEAKGGGPMTLESSSLNFSIDATLSAEVSAKAGSGRGATFFKDEQGRITVPLKITGPAGKPSVGLDKEKLVQKGTERLLEKGKKELFERFFRGR